MQLPPNHIPYANLQSHLLIADPSLSDGTFDRSVIYLVDHQPDKFSAGFILNKPTGMNVEKFTSATELEPLKNIPVYYGGPCDDSQLIFLSFKWTKCGELKCRTSIDADQAIQLSKDPQSLLRAFLGHSAWSAGQLAQELDHKAWITTTPSESILEHPSDITLWKTLLEPLSPFHKILSRYPESPELN